MEEIQTIRISVRNLVEFILREGDIDNRISGSMEKDAMLLGGKIHRKIQSRMGTNYTAEVPLKIQMPCDGFVLQIEGRADGVLKDDGKVLIDEIKGILRSLEHLEAPVPVHLAQAKCYAYIYANQETGLCADTVRYLAYSMRKEVGCGCFSLLSGRGKQPFRVSNGVLSYSIDVL